MITAKQIASHPRKDSPKPLNEQGGTALQ